MIKDNFREKFTVEVKNEGGRNKSVHEQWQILS